MPFKEYLRDIIRDEQIENLVFKIIKLCIQLSFLFYLLIKENRDKLNSILGEFIIICGTICVNTYWEYMRKQSYKSRNMEKKQRYQNQTFRKFVFGSQIGVVITILFSKALRESFPIDTYSFILVLTIYIVNLKQRDGQSLAMSVSQTVIVINMMIQLALIIFSMIIFDISILGKISIFLIGTLPLGKLAQHFYMKKQSYQQYSLRQQTREGKIMEQNFTQNDFKLDFKNIVNDLSVGCGIVNYVDFHVQFINQGVQELLELRNEEDFQEFMTCQLKIIQTQEFISSKILKKKYDQQDGFPFKSNSAPIIPFQQNLNYSPAAKGRTSICNISFGNIELNNKNMSDDEVNGDALYQIGTLKDLIQRFFRRKKEDSKSPMKERRQSVDLTYQRDQRDNNDLSQKDFSDAQFEFRFPSHKSLNEEKKLQVIAEYKNKTLRFEIKQQINLYLLKQDTLLVMVTDITTLQAQKMKIVHIEASNRMISSISHQLRTPLNCSIMMLRMAMECQNIDDVLQKLMILPALNSNVLLNSQINDIIDLNHIWNDQFSLYFENINIKELVIECTNLFELQSQQKQLKITQIFSQSIRQHIRTDQNRLQQVIINFLSNSIKFTEVGGIEIFVISVGSNYIEISIADTGCGIGKDDLDQIFDNFGSSNPSKSLKTRGAGLGLTINSQLVRYLSGGSSISLYSELGLGTNFKFLIQNFENDEEAFVKRNSYSLHSSHSPGSSSLIENNHINRINFEKSNSKQFLKESQSISVQPSIFKKYGSSNNENLDDSEQEGLGINNIQLSTNRTGIFEKHRLFQVNVPPQGTFFSIETNMKPQPSINNQDKSKSAKVELSEKLSFNEKISHEIEYRKCHCQRVLIVDDNQFNVLSLQTYLDYFGIDCETAFSGQMAIDLIVKRFYDKCKMCRIFQLIFMDIDMPHKDGIQTTQEILAFYEEQKYEETPKICCNSAYVDEHHKKMALASGMVQFLPKPIDEKSLKYVLNKYLMEGEKSSLERVDSFDNFTSRSKLLKYEFKC